MADVKQERSGEVGFWDRFALKNLSDNAEEQARYLAETRKDLMVGIKDGQVVLKKKEDKDWKTLDPKGFDVEDISDIVSDIGTGIVSGAATTLGGLAAGAATGGVGTIPAAMAAGAASSAGLEALKQKLAQMYGVKKSPIDMGDVAMQGAMGAASPLLFGVGASAKQIGKFASPESAAKKLVERFTEEGVEGGLSAAQKETAKEALASSGEGMLTRLGRTATSMLSGSDEEALRTARKMLPKVQAMEKSGATKEFTEATAEKARAAFVNKIEETGARINKVVDESGAKFDVDEYRKPFLKEIERLAKSTREEDRLLADEIRGEMESVFKKDVVDAFGRTVGSEPMKFATANEMQAIKASLLDLSGGRRLPTGRSGIAGKDFAPARLRSVASEAGAKAADDFDKVVIKTAKNIKDRNLLQDYKILQKLRNDLGPKLKDAQTAARTLSVATNKNKRQLFEQMQEADKLLGTDLAERAKTVEAFKVWNKPSWSAISSKGSTSTSRTGSSGIAGSGGADIVADAIGADPKSKHLMRVLGAMGLTTAVSPAAQRKYFEMTQPLVNVMSKIPNQHAASQSAWQLMQGE